MILLLVTVYCLVRWADASSPEPADAATRASTASPPRAGLRSRESTPTAHHLPARPVALHIPAIGVSSRLVELGLNRDGTVEVPTDPGLAGWYGLGTRPGARGSAVILGHVDSVDGPAVFFRLRTLAAGDAVNVRIADGATELFRVESVRTYANDRFPARLVYAARGGRVLNLVTCGGAYDASRGGYQSNVVVRARWVRVTA